MLSARGIRMLSQQLPHGWHATVCVVLMLAERHYFFALMALGCRIPPDIATDLVSCSPLEGDCRPSRADMTEPGPQRPGFSFA
jgi:hypothetical protein